MSELCARNFYHEMRCTDTAAAEIPKKTPNDWANTNLLGHDSLRGMGWRREEGQSKFADTGCVHPVCRERERKASGLSPFGPFSVFLLCLPSCSPFRIRVSAFRIRPSRPSVVSQFHVAAEAAKNERSGERRAERRARRSPRSRETGGEIDARLDKTCSILLFSGSIHHLEVCNKVCNKET